LKHIVSTPHPTKAKKKEWRSTTKQPTSGAKSFQTQRGQLLSLGPNWILIGSLCSTPYYSVMHIEMKKEETN